MKQLKYFITAALFNTWILNILPATLPIHFNSYLKKYLFQNIEKMLIMHFSLDKKMNASWYIFRFVSYIVAICPSDKR